MGKLRVEEPTTSQAVVVQIDGRQVAAAAAPAKQSLAAEGVDYWRATAITTAKRLEYAEAQMKDLRTAADEVRARAVKYKDRLDKANERNNEQQVQLVRVSAERDELRSQLAKQDKVARLLHEYRQSLMEGPLWQLFVEIAVASPLDAGEEKS